MDADIAIVVSPRDWAERLHRFVADHGGARVRARVLDAREALGASYAVLVVEDLTSFLTPRLIDELHRMGRRVVGVHDPAEPWGRERLVEVGVDEHIPSDAEPDEFLRVVQALAATLDLDDELSALVEGGVERQELALRGLVIAVGGPFGGTGTTEVAVAVAHARVTRRARRTSGRRRCRLVGRAAPRAAAPSEPPQCHRPRRAASGAPR